MKYSFTCPCQKLIPVDAVSAGSEIVCECGSKAAVPRLSQLRVMSGQGAYEAGSIDTIARMLQEGTLPWGETCLISGMPTADCLEVYVECEKLHVARQYAGLVILSAVFLGWLAIVLKNSLKEHDPQGRETRIQTPLRIAHEYHQALSKTRSQRQLRRLLREVPIYGKLLDEYPAAKIVVGRMPENEGMKLDPKFAV